ncbi:ABC transporter permease [Kibdelosporangium phytohabitans]|uniref:Transport permease protein n=1 Tax=Kibdelosporangium phytohabitans TaxID=860235 RepID=A0A0N7F329_9PSEU|nr:ABC transporter permease [Kibdelosporangium phytohabitans]ALG07479.1 ABC transporter permease [Kibdelosporangium phytohabitans]MBE1471611.1 lipooligosaccharide transport system permease protein [Kibdelosporangium phytohabitans]
MLRPWQARLLVVESMWTWYRRNWRATAVSTVLNPVFFLVALGFGLGSQIQPGAITHGYSYAVYLMPAMLASAAVQNAAGESTFPILSGFKWSRVYWGMTATPITPAQVATGQLLWILCRLTFSATVFAIIGTVLGAAAGPGIVLSLVFAVLTGMAFSAPLVAFAATVEGEGHAFNPVFRFLVLPMTLLAGTFFPITELPALVRPLAWITPLWHGTELTRAAAFWDMRLWPVLGHLAYLLALVAVGGFLAIRHYRRRLGV